MGKYTTQLRSICEQKAGRTESVDYSGINDVITQSAPLIFGDFPIFDEAYRSVLETKIIKHYYTREICEETVGLWQLRLNTRMNEIMPYYNKLYQSELLEFNPLEDYRMETTRNVNKKGNETGEKEKGEHTSYGSEKSVDETYNDSLKQTGTDTLTQTGTDTLTQTGTDKVVQTHNDITKKDGTQHTTGTQWEMFSATPQGTLNNVENETYLTSATKNTNNTTVTNEEKTENNGGYTSTDTKNLTNTDTKNLTNTDTKNLTNTGTGTKNKVEDIEGSNDKTSNENATKQITNTEEYIESKRGKIGTKSYAKMLMEFRESLLNIDKMIIDELSDLFMLIW